MKILTISNELSPHVYNRWHQKLFLPAWLVAMAEQNAANTEGRES